MMEKPIEVRNITKRFGSFTAVDAVSFSVNAGEIFGFLGPNGAGKSTTIKMLCGILAPTEGKGHVLGFDITKQREKIRQNIGYMSQRFSFYEEMSVKENLEFFGALYGLEGEALRSAIQRSLEIAEIGERENETVKALPAGMKQRLALGGALLHDPSVLFLDEPTSGVDPIMRRNFWEFIHALSRKGRTIFVTTHYMEEAENCDRVAFIIGGKIIAMDTPSRLKAAFEYDVYRLEVGNFIEAFDTIRRLDFLEEAAVFGNELHLICERGFPLKKELAPILKKYQYERYSLELISPTLEDVFVQRARAE